MCIIRKDKVSTKHEVAVVVKLHVTHTHMHEFSRFLPELQLMSTGEDLPPQRRRVCDEVGLSLHSLPASLLQGQIARRTISVQTEQAKRGIQSHPTEHLSTLPPPTLHPHLPICSFLSPPLFIISFILCLHLCKSLHFRCIHTFSVSLCMSFPPSLSPASSVPPSVHPSLPFFVFPLAFSSSDHTRLFLYFLASTSFFLYSLHPITVIHHSSISHHANRPPGCHSNQLRLAVCSPVSDWLARA